jgi:hypothetical protein
MKQVPKVKSLLHEARTMVTTLSFSYCASETDKKESYSLHPFSINHFNIQVKIIVIRNTPGKTFCFMKL